MITLKRRTDEGDPQAWTSEDGYSVLRDGQPIGAVWRVLGVSPGYYNAWRYAAGPCRAGGAGTRREAVAALVLLAGSDPSPVQPSPQ